VEQGGRDSDHQYRIEYLNRDCVRARGLLRDRVGILNHPVLTGTRLICQVHYLPPCHLGWRSSGAIKVPGLDRVLVSFIPLIGAMGMPPP
jgi:hypothetical protein